jgi:hypothetical protein
LGIAMPSTGCFVELCGGRANPNRALLDLAQALKGRELVSIETGLSPRWDRRVLACVRLFAKLGLRGCTATVAKASEVCIALLDHSELCCG